MNDFKIERATMDDISELYSLQLIAFESEAEMIGSRQVPALQESAEENRNDFPNWQTLKIINGEGEIIAALRYKHIDGIVEVGRVMTHPEYRLKGLAVKLLEEVDKIFPQKTKELYTCTKSWTNIRLYEKVGYKADREVTEDNGLSFVYMRK